MFQRICMNLFRKQSSEINIKCRCGATFQGNAEARHQRNLLFTKEKQRQRENIGRIEKIEVQYTGTPEDVTLMMNKGISTPFNCAQHMSEMLMQRSALALIDDTTLWDMNHPLEADCQLRLLHFRDPDPYHVNKAFWRSCSMLLGAMAENVFKEEVHVELHSFPSPNVKTGSFVYDVNIGLDNWQPSQDELRIMSSQMVTLCQKNLKFERLEVNVDLALEMFKGNKYKREQIPHIASQISEGKTVVLYRVGDHIDLSRGPMVGDTSFVGKCTVTAVHQIETEQGILYRFQGVALPKGFLLNHFAYGILEDRAKKLNPGRLPSAPSHVSDVFQPASEAMSL
ncbi:39S ribosomal protein L39, mitochondrial [Cryptotermes secundus]|uniref:Large ribosomal subunit protein mL39 n=1 Tax=Cryptotermes secundus TaxID=105785 RepID=A0A2J7QXP0_9NEOP|nr:39S ribosomal protein L39, mitochondrial [Cryptotermes secundus]PNF33348.1 39S ribosomal protein L39, mitochondrial [Cryptotermes secundus]PNF33349.1 39S ribosomal protein L39, mitochondrial [Cryptotermes secundus]PNF33350.1 39S ribosomal protein L39, mitochondrial [Cryptotermes secundus]